jgi:integrase
MAVRKIKGSWWIDFRANHQRIRKRSPDNTKAGAETYEAILRQKAARGEPIDDQQRQPKDQTFAQFAPKWCEDYVKPNNKYSEQLAKKYVLSSSLIPFFGSMLIGQIRAHDIERYKAHQVRQGFTNKTIMNRLTVLNKCLGTAYEWLELDGAPPKIKWPRWQSPEIDYLSPDECEVLLAHAEGVIQEMVLMGLRTGMRQAEMRGLQWSSIDWITRSVAVRHARDDYRKLLVSPKNNRTRHIPLDVDVYAMLYERRRDVGYVFLPVDGRPFTNDRLSAAMRRLCRKADLRKIGWHTLRHTFASHLAMRGVPLPAIKELMGHASITTTMRYAHVAPSTLRAAIEMLNPKTMINADFGQPVVNQWQQMQKYEIDQKPHSPKYG